MGHKNASLRYLERLVATVRLLSASDLLENNNSRDGFAGDYVEICLYLKKYYFL